MNKTWEGYVKQRAKLRRSRFVCSHIWKLERRKEKNNEEESHKNPKDVSRI